MNTPKLKPCPFCGGDVYVEYDGDFYASHEFYVTCVCCSIQVPIDGEVVCKNVSAATREGAAMWNRRAADNDSE